MADSENIFVVEESPEGGFELAPSHIPSILKPIP